VRKKAPARSGLCRPERDYMGDYDLVAIGASAGGVEALRKLVRSFPRDFPAAVLVVLHLPPWHTSNLPELLGHESLLPAAFPSFDERIDPARIYVAPPDRHMVVEDGRVQLWRGPKEDRQRPSINALFRSVAVSHGQRAVGVVLTGSLDDGSAGLWWIKKYGGVAIVQDPADAAFPGMAQSALEYVDVDYVVPLSEIGDLLVGLAGRGKWPNSGAARLPEARKIHSISKQEEE